MQGGREEGKGAAPTEGEEVEGEEEEEGERKHFNVNIMLF